MNNNSGNNSGIKKSNLSIKTCEEVFNESQNFKYCEKVLLLMFGIFPNGEKRSRFFNIREKTPNTENDKKKKIQEIKNSQGFLGIVGNKWKKTNEQKWGRYNK